MACRMGCAGVRGFKKMLAAVAVRDYAEAADEMLDSKWHREDSPARAERMAALMAAVDGKAAVC